MSPLPHVFDRRVVAGDVSRRDKGRPQDLNGAILESWAEGYMVGSLIIMSCITLANMRKGVLLHKLILLELVFGYWQGFSMLFPDPIFGWWLSVAAVPLNTSWVLHNVISWMKLRPFLSKFWSRLFIGTIILSIPYWIVEIYANFTFFHNINNIFLHTRPFEALCRDPWWILAAIILFYNIKTRYDLTVIQIARISPRFAVMLGAMVISIIFIVLDVLSVTSALSSALPVGINPFWKLSFVFKCLTDSVVLDDFKTALDRLRAFKISRLGSFAMDASDSRTKEHQAMVQNSNNWDEPPDFSRPAVPVAELPPIVAPTTIDDKPDAHRSKPKKTRDTRYANIIRSASRDRDIEENGISAMDHVDADIDRQASNAHILDRQDQHWPNRHSMTTSVDDDEDDYAAAVREVTHGSPTLYEKTIDKVK